MAKKHISYRGQVVDMEMIKFQHQMQPALGNANLNARGDKIDRGGTVLKTREELIAERERELQVPDILPEHQSHSVAPAVDDGFDDSMFEVPDTNNEPVQQEKAAPVKRAKTKQDNQE